MHASIKITIRRDYQIIKKYGKFMKSRYFNWKFVTDSKKEIGLH